uniref:Phosphoribosyl pyrophosphate synthase-associated protein 2 n=1 Tax=Cacopsylla melanoneura TaxID=428564 RepID=A0A8D8UK31_9HEMI
MDSGPGSSDIMILSGNSHMELASLVASRLGVKLGGCSVYHKTNRETMVEIGDSVRGKDIYIIQTGTKDVNNHIMELLIMAYACKTSSAKSIVGVIPYLPYSKQCKMRKRGCIVSKLLAKMMCTSGLKHIITMDLHQKEIQGFFDCPVDNLRASPFLLQYIQDSIPDYRNAVIVAKNPGAAKKATSYAERLRLGIAVIHGEQKESETDEALLITVFLSSPPSCNRWTGEPPPHRHLMYHPPLPEQWKWTWACRSTRPKRNRPSVLWAM